MKRKQLWIGSLFSGIGGIELGLERAGFKTKWFVESNTFCKQVLNKNWPSVPIYDNVKTCNWKEMHTVDVLTGGFPCQDISIAGKGIGIKGKRSGLWKYFLKAIVNIKPKYVVIENVSILRKRGFNKILKDIWKAGYNVEWCCFSASEFGAPHKRERLFIIAHSNEVRFNNCLNIKQNNEVPFYKEWNTQKGWKAWRNLAFRVAKNIRSCNWKKNLSRVYRMDYGIPNWMDRVGALGNSVVPQITEYIGMKIMFNER